MFGQVLKHYRKKHNLTQKQLAESVDVHVSTIKQYEAGYREPSIKNIVIFPDEVVAGYVAEWRKLVHGRLEESDDGDGAVCSVCGIDFCNLIHETDNFNHCPNCGAKIDGVDDQ